MDKRYSLSHLNASIKEALLEAFPSTIWVMAEISELKQNRNGHCYLELIEKKDETIVARSRATIWSYTFRMLRPYFETTTGQSFTSGIKVLVQASVEYHPAYGLSLNIKDIDPTYTLGDLAMQRKEIIQKLEKDGVLNMNKELDLPLVPQKIAVISSATAAGLQDFLDQLENNQYGFSFHTRLFEASMQGAETVPTIIRALEQIYDQEDFFDVVVILRGGGATADLNSFDSYDLAYNITQFPLPVLTGIGHEKDDTIIDLVAHTRLKTPTAVAEFLIMGLLGFQEKLMWIQQTVVEKVGDLVAEEKQRLDHLGQNLDFEIKTFLSEQLNQLNTGSLKLQSSVERFVIRKEQELQSLKGGPSNLSNLYFLKRRNRLEQQLPRLNRVVGKQLDLNKNMIVGVKDKLSSSLIRKLQLESERLHAHGNSIRLLSPENVLKRGYSLTLKGGKVVKHIDQVEVDDLLETRIGKGKIESRILKKS